MRDKYAAIREFQKKETDENAKKAAGANAKKEAVPNAQKGAVANAKKEPEQQKGHSSFYYQKK